MTVPLVISKRRVLKPKSSLADKANIDTPSTSKIIQMKINSKAHNAIDNDHRFDGTDIVRF